MDVKEFCDLYIEAVPTAYLYKDEIYEMYLESYMSRGLDRRTFFRRLYQVLGVTSCNRKKTVDGQRKYIVPGVAWDVHTLLMLQDAEQRAEKIVEVGA